MPFGPIVRAMRHNKTRVLLIVLEIAVTLAIVTNCVNMIVDERRKMHQKSGFDDDNLLWVRVRPFSPEFNDQKTMTNTIESDRRLLESVPGVKSVWNTNFIPWQGGGSSTNIKAAGTKNGALRTQIYYGEGDLFDTLGAKLAEGRKFVPNDYDYDQVNGNPSVVIISKALAQLVFGTPHAIGRQIDDGQAVYTIVGTIDQFYNPYGWPIHEYVVIGPSQVGSYARGERFLLRVEPGAMKSVVPLIDTRIIRANSGRVVELKTINEYKDLYFAGGRLVMRGMSGVIAVLVFVTALGILGLTSLSVAERTKQIGTRRALGATKGHILTHFLLENWMVTTAGLVIGIVATYALNFLLVTRVSGAKMDWRYVAVGMALLWVNGVAATLLPALRGTRVSPAIATRSV
jgi:putative ABC transport system permease protein